tara:strand:- start:554 stop:832 length:279 start_codon:yes stop_codon:yes gene_type:complete
MKHNTQVIHGVKNAIALADKLEAETGTSYEVVNFRMLLEGYQLRQDVGEEEVINYLDRGKHKEEACLVMDEPCFWMLSTLIIQAFKSRGVLH